MKKNRFFVIATLILILSLSIIFCACDPKDDTDPVSPDGGGSGDSSGEVEECTITYEEVDGVHYSSSNPTKVNKGESVMFEFTVDVFYEGEPIVKVNTREKTLEYDEEKYTYSCETTVSRNTTISIEGIAKAESQLLSTGTGASDNPFVISKPIDLIKMAEVINSGAENSTMSVLGYYVLENDIDLRGNELEIIGDGNNNYAFFGGYLNGGGHTISNFKINSNGKDYVGLFGIVQSNYYDTLGFTGGTIFNLKLSDYTITAVNNGTTVTCGSFVGQGFGANLVLCEAINGTLDVMGDVNYFSYAGGIIGLQRSFQYPYYSKVSYCSANNIDIGCSNGTTYAAGGIAGYVYSDDDTIATTLTNCYTSGKISGAFHAGGIVGWLSNYTSMSACYSLCDIHAQSHMSYTSESTETYCHAYAGGLVGMAQLDSVIADSFATGSISAYAVAGESYAHRGEIVARVEKLEDGMYSAKNAGVFNCHYVEGGKSETLDFTKTATIKSVLGWHEIDWIFEDGKYPVVNGVNSTTDDDNQIEQHYQYTVTLDFGGRTDVDGNQNYSATFADQYESMNYWYNVYFFSEESNLQGLPSVIYSTDGYVSYGYFFDKDLKVPVSCGFIPMRDITLYVGFANNNDVAGTYYVLPNSDYEDSNNDTVELILNVDGTYECVDRFGSHKGSFVYNGEYVVFDDAKFARYYGEGDIANYQSYEYKAVKASYGFDLYGGLYSDIEQNEVIELVSREKPLKVFKAENTIIGSYYYKDGADTIIYEFFANGNGRVYESGVLTEFTYTISGQTISISVDGSEIGGSVNNDVVENINSINVTSTDVYRGKWEISSLSQKYMEFDGAGNWKYTHYGYVISGGEMYNKLIDSQEGTYTIDQDKLVLNNGAIASINNGFVNIVSGNSQYVFGGVDGNYGLWMTADNGIIIELKGISKDGYGNAQIRFVTTTNGRVRNEIYDLTYAPDMLIEGSIVLFYQGEYFGSVSYNENSGSLQGSIYSLTISDMINVRFYRVDEYKGEWISSDGTFNAVDFNGYGIYTILGDVSLNGTIAINGTTVNYRLDEFSLDGSFTYEGNIYYISMDEGRNIIKISESGKDIELIRKDEFGKKTFLDKDGNVFYFDGRGAIDGALTATINGTPTNYIYKLNDDGSVDVYSGETKVGEINIVGEVGSRNYVLTLNGAQHVLGEKTQFTGTWALETSFDNHVVIGTMNYDKVLDGVVPLVINDKSDNFTASFTLVDNEYLVWTVNESMDLYVVQIKEGLFVISQHLNWFNYDNDFDNDLWNYSYMTEFDDLTGNWTNDKRHSQVYTFDGTGKNPEALAMYTISNLYTTDEDEAEPSVRYYGYFERVDGSGYDYLIFTNYSTYARSASKVIITAPTGDRNEFVNDAGDKAFILESVDLSDYILIRE